MEAVVRLRKQAQVLVLLNLVVLMVLDKELQDQQVLQTEVVAEVEVTMLLHQLVVKVEKVLLYLNTK